MQNAASQLSPAAPLAASDIERRKEIHNLHFTITQAVKNTYSVWLIALFVTVPAWGHVPFWLWSGWVVLVGAAYSVRARQLSGGRNIDAVEAAPQAWARRLTGWTLGCSAIAALGPSLFYPSIGEIARMYICMLFCCWLAGAMASLGARPRLFAIYAAVFTVGLGIGWLQTDSAFLAPIFVMLVLYALVLTGFARNFARQVDDSVEIRFINERLVEQLTRSRETAEKSSEAKTRFLAVASHDLRQPLHAVTLLNGMLARPQTAEKIKEISRQMDRSLSTLERLFSSVLDFSKIDAAKVKPELGWHPLAPLLEQLEDEYAPQAAQKGLALRAKPISVMLHTDLQLLGRILRNLVENAIKFTDRGSIEIVATQRPDGAVVLAVCDSGPGIPRNLRDEIFDEYFQAPGDNSTSGLGLGLAIVRRLAALLGVSVTVDDAENHGTRFDVGVESSMVRPLSDADAVASGQDVTPLDLQDYLVVYVEDDASSREALGLLMADWGCKCVISETMAGALQALEGKGVPDVILSDFSLRDGCTGTEVIEEMRRRYGPVSGAILTGESSAMQLRLAGEFEYPVLGKPVKAQDLRALLEVFKGIG